MNTGIDGGPTAVQRVFNDITVNRKVLAINELWKFLKRNSQTTVCSKLLTLGI
jgi:hypothetical protein